MTTLQLKNKIQERLKLINDEQLLNTIYEILSSTDNEVVKLTPEHKKSVMRGLEQMKNGEVSSHEDAMNELKEWLEEK